MERMMVVESLQRTRVAEVHEDACGQPVVHSDNAEVVSVLEELIRRGHRTGLIYCHNQYQKTSEGQVYRTYGRWTKPGDPDFLEALADALVEFNLFAYVIELVVH